MSNLTSKWNEENDSPLTIMSRRKSLKVGMQSIVAWIIGLAAIWEAQDWTVASVTPWTTLLGRNLETPQESGFAKTVNSLQEDILALKGEFKKGNIDSQQMEEMLAKLLLNEKTVMPETQKTLDIIWGKLEKTYQWVVDWDERKESIKKLWTTILTLKTNLGEGFNLIKAIFLITELAEDETYRNETSSVNRPYFRGISSYIESPSVSMMADIDAYEKSFNAEPSDRIKVFKDTLGDFSEKIGGEKGIEVDKGDIIMEWPIQSRNIDRMQPWIAHNKKEGSLLLPNTNAVAVLKTELSAGNYIISFRGNSPDIKIGFWIIGASWQTVLYIKSWESGILKNTKKWALIMFNDPSQAWGIIVSSLSLEKKHN